MKRSTLFLFLLFSIIAIAGRAQSTSGLAHLIQARVESFKRMMDTSEVFGAGLGYSVIMGSNRLDTTDFCFSITPVVSSADLDQTFKNYYYVLGGRPVLLYLNYSSMLHLVAELGAQEINKANLEEIRGVLMNVPFFLSRQPYQICCSKDGILSGDIVFPPHEHVPEIVKPEGIPLKYPDSFAGYKASR